MTLIVDVAHQAQIFNRFLAKKITIGQSAGQEYRLGFQPWIEVGTATPPSSVHAQPAYIKVRQ